MLRKLLKAVAILLAAAVALAGGYVAYVFIAYHRLPDVDTNLVSALDGEADYSDQDKLQVGRIYKVVTWNLGFGAYSADFGFFMDGGTESRAFSKAAVLQNIGHAVEVLEAEAPDFTLLQEVDIGSTRSYQVNEADIITEALGGCARFAQNYDSPYLLYPIARPHGASRSGMLTLSPFPVVRWVRRSLPVEGGFRKLLDLDRCYSKSYIEVAGAEGRLVLYNFHLSAYTSDGSIATEQLRRMCADMQEEYRAGNYCVAGGDFNKDVLGNSGEVFGRSLEGLPWAQPIETALIPEGLGLVSPLNGGPAVPSCRNADGPYVPGESLVLTVDGFIVSDNVAARACRVIDEGFAVSDHNPVELTFALNQ